MSCERFPRRPATHGSSPRCSRDWPGNRQADLPERFRGKIAILVPAYNEAENIGQVLDLMPSEVCGVQTAVLVVDDGSRDGTGDVAAEHGAVVARHVINRGGGAALRTGYRLMVDSGAEVVSVTLDADGQHLPSEMERLVKPVLIERQSVPNKTGPAVLLSLLYPASLRHKS